MTKADLIEQLCGQEEGLTKKEAGELIEAIMETMKSALAEGESIRFPGFGTFEVRAKLPRTGRNPRTGEAIVIAARRVLVFRTSTQLRSKMNQLG